jgi:hypothetical protein
LDEVWKMSNNTAVTNPNLPMPSFGNPDHKPGPKITSVEVGPFRLKGVKIDTSQYTGEQFAEMISWAKENKAYVNEESGLFSWKDEAKRDWFILRWS